MRYGGEAFSSSHYSSSSPCSYVLGLLVLSLSATRYCGYALKERCTEALWEVFRGLIRNSLLIICPPLPRNVGPEKAPRVPRHLTVFPFLDLSGGGGKRTPRLWKFQFLGVPCWQGWAWSSRRGSCQSDALGEAFLDSSHLLLLELSARSALFWPSVDISMRHPLTGNRHSHDQSSSASSSGASKLTPQR